MSEETRNRVLRRADWRFLLSAPMPASSAVFANGDLAEAVAAVSERVVDGRREKSHAACDLAVAVDPDAATLRAAWSSLRPGGSCYTEWSSRTAVMIRRRLQAAGFADVMSFTPRPSPNEAPPQFWMPLGASRALRWHARRTRDVRGKRRAARHAARTASWRLAAWLPVATPVCTVARKPGTYDAGSVGRVGPDFQAELRRSIQERQSGGAPVDLTHPWVMLTPGAHSSNKVILLALDADGRPDLAVKAPRTTAAAAAIGREAAALERVRDLYGHPSGVPQVVFAGCCAGVRTIAETAVHGQSVSHLVHRIDPRALALKAVEWQAKLVDPSGPQPRSRWWPRIVEPVVRYLEGPLAPMVDPALVRATRAELSRLGSLPRACEQRDFSPWNVLVAPEGDLAVLDWESAEPEGLPALDLIYFLTYFLAYRNRASSADELRRVHRESLDPGTPAGALTRECLASYMRMTGIDPAALRPLRVLCWLLHSRSEYDRMMADPERRDPSVLRDSTFVALWQQELQALQRTPNDAGPN